MAALASLPVFMRVGTTGGMHKVGSIELPVDGDGWLTFDRAKIAAAIRALADAIDKPPSDQEVPDAAPE